MTTVPFEFIQTQTEEQTQRMQDAYAAANRCIQEFSKTPFTNPRYAAIVKTHIETALAFVILDIRASDAAKQDTKTKE